MVQKIFASFRYSLLLTLLLLSSNANAQVINRFEQDLSNQKWKIFIDENAQWQDDSLYLPPINIASIPVNIPSAGWRLLENETLAVTTQLPATVEEYFWGKRGSSFGVTGNYLGVSWFTTKVLIPNNLKGKRITLHFESVRFRAEVFVNKKLVGYDIVNSTPFDVDISKAVNLGQLNDIAVRITDPNGNFDWRDSKNFMWGDYRTIPSHGFGGITGKVKLVATDPTYIEDIFIKNKPTPNEIDVEVSLSNLSSQEESGTLTLSVVEWKNPSKVVYQELRKVQLQPNENSLVHQTMKVENAKLWDIHSPNLYVLRAEWNSLHSKDRYDQRFGFRWFEVHTVNGDKQFYLNGKRTVLFTAISWGFWPLNGIMPSDELAKKQVLTAKNLGLTMLNFHRTIGSQNVLDYADELGLLYFEEPGGYQFPFELFTPRTPLEQKQHDFYIPCRREKLFRMIRRDRNHPSLIIYNMHNERGSLPSFQDSIDMADAHRLDETRILTYNSCNGNIKMGPDPQFKLHMLPYDSSFYDYGWFDQHHAGGPGVYHNGVYTNPTNYIRYTDKKDEIIYWGEEGAIGTPPRLQLIYNEIQKTGTKRGWETSTYLEWYKAYNDFLHNNNFTSAFKDVDALTTSMGNVSYYYQGRAIENIRINNVADGYAINGWESMILENHSGIVDDYRNIKAANPELISKYLQPLYIAVKIPRKVTSVGDTIVADFFIVNEVDLYGAYTLDITVTDSSGIRHFPSSSVLVTGGVTYGELLKSDLLIPIRNDGYTTVQAELKLNGKIITEGSDQVFATTLPSISVADGMVADTTQALQSFLKTVGIKNFQDFRNGTPEGSWLLVGAFQPPPDKALVTDILEWVNNGNTLIVVNAVEQWADYLAQKEVLDYRGSRQLGKSWYGGNYFVRYHPLFNGLPQATAFNWEYQCFAAYDRNRIGLRLFNGETIVGCVSDHKREVYSALSIIPHGRGTIILCALDIPATIKTKPLSFHSVDEEGQTAAFKDLTEKSRDAANVVGQRLLLNMLQYTNHK